MQKTKGGYPTVNGLTNGETFLLKRAKVLGCCDSHVGAAGWKNLKFEHCTKSLIEQSIIAYALQDFAQDQVGDADSLATEFAF